jgi:predicted signal transduction protein with EAL and GGDEF domain
VTEISLDGNDLDEFHCARVDELLARNNRLRHLFLFDARKMLLSVLCGDECGVVLPYLLDRNDIDAVVALDKIEMLRAEFAVVVEERRRRAATAVRSVEAVVDESGRCAAKRRRTKR